MQDDSVSFYFSFLFLLGWNRGYLHNGPATRGTMAPGGWLKTGDLCRVDEEGYFTVIDRLKELIKYKGYQGSFLCVHPIQNLGMVG